jgi:hypothetical protein
VEIGDAYGAMITAFHEGGEAVEIIERDDGYIAASRFGPKIYFAPLRNWFKNERAAIRFARGRVLDVARAQAASRFTFSTVDSPSSRSTTHPARSS